MEIDSRISEAAGRLMSDPAFKAACEKTEEKYTAQWRDSGLLHTDDREAAYRSLHALIHMLRTLRGFWETGEAEKLAAAKKAKADTLDL